MKEYIMDVHGFQEENITILMDDGNNTSPTHDNILAAYKQIVAESEAGDVVFCHYSGKSYNSNAPIAREFVWAIAHIVARAYESRSRWQAQG
jgi:hypothetical protein